MKLMSRNSCAIVLALTAFCSVFLTNVIYADQSNEVDSVTEDLEGDEGLSLDSRAELRDTNMMCQRYNYDYRRCVAAGCLFDGGSGTCYGQLNPAPGPHPFPPNGPSYCRQFNHNQFQCQRAGCYFDHRNGACFDGSPQPPNVPGYRVMCVAVDAGFEEHHRGHVGIGHNRYAAEQGAMGDCLRYHGRCRIRECRFQ